MQSDTKKDTREPIYMKIEKDILEKLEKKANKEGITRNNFIIRLLKKEAESK